MLKQNKGTLILTSFMMLIPMVVGLILWNRLPEEIPVHWNAQGEVDGYGSRALVVFGLPGLMLALQWLCIFVTSLDPKSKDISKKSVRLVLWLIPVICIPMCLLCYGTALGMDISVEVVVPMLVGIIFVVLGNYLPKCKRNYTIGFKLPWTLDSDENWNKTHRLAGKLMVAAGFLLIFSSLLGFAFIALFAAIGLVMVPVVYSYLLYKKEKK